MFRFTIGDKVADSRPAADGRRLTGEVRAAFSKADGSPRYVVEVEAARGGTLLLILDPAVLDAATPEPS
jgi:hypothetical protein